MHRFRYTTKIHAQRQRCSHPSGWKYNHLAHKIETGVPPLMEIPIIIERNPSEPDDKFYCYAEMKCKGMGFRANAQRVLLPWKMTRVHPKIFDPPTYDKSSAGGIEYNASRLLLRQEQVFLEPHST